jgi:hypothetical protein
VTAAAAPVEPLVSQVDAPALAAAADTASAADDAAAALPDLSGLSSLGGLAGGLPQATLPPGAGAAALIPPTREVLSTPEARSLAAVLAIGLAVLLFLAVQGRFDRSEPKLASVRDGREVGRFR